MGQNSQLQAYLMKDCKMCVTSLSSLGDGLASFCCGTGVTTARVGPRSGLSDVTVTLISFTHIVNVLNLYLCA